MSQYIAKCRECGKRLKDPADKPIYVVRTDEYFCNQKCLTKNANTGARPRYEKEETKGKVSKM